MKYKLEDIQQKLLGNDCLELDHEDDLIIISDLDEIPKTIGLHTF